MASWLDHLLSGKSKTLLGVSVVSGRRIWVGFCLTGQLSIARLCAFNNQTRIAAHIDQECLKALFFGGRLCLGLTSGGLHGASRRFSFPVIRHSAIKNDSSAIL
jgi:hypothetical protein